MKPLALFFLLLGGLPAADISSYSDQASRLIGAALEDNSGMARLEYLCDRIGNRVSGSASLERAIVWAAAEMKRAGLENVQTPAVTVPKWVRGAESLTLLAPVERSLAMLGLGNSVGTPPAGIAADVVVVTNFDELTALGREKVAGLQGRSCSTTHHTRATDRRCSIAARDLREPRR